MERDDTLLSLRAAVALQRIAADPPVESPFAFDAYGYNSPVGTTGDHKGTPMYIGGGLILLILIIIVIVLLLR